MRRGPVSISLRSLLLAAGLGLCLASNAPAQPAQPPPDNTVSPVVVSPSRLSDEEMIKTIIAPFVESHAARNRKSGVLIRQPVAGVCPVTLGLDARFNDFVTARIMAVAELTGAGVQPAGQCRPNVEVFFTADPQGLVNGLSRKTGGAILGLHFWHEAVQLVHVTRPVQSWYVTGSAGDPTARGASIGRNGEQISVHSRPQVDDAYGPTPHTGTGSHVPPRISSRFINALVVVDARELAGREIGPVSDYVAMLALSQPRSADACTHLPSILDLYASCPGREPPTSLTEADISFLKALYAADISTSGRRGLDNVEHKVAKDLKEPR
jgi:hypothetical protein